MVDAGYELGGYRLPDLIESALPAGLRRRPSPGRLEAVAPGIADGRIKLVVCGAMEAEVGREIRALLKEGLAESDIAVSGLSQRFDQRN